DNVGGGGVGPAVADPEPAPDAGHDMCVGEHVVRGKHKTGATAAVAAGHTHDLHDALPLTGQRWRTEHARVRWFRECAAGRESPEYWRVGAAVKEVRDIGK